MYLCDRLVGRKTFLDPALVVFSYMIDSMYFADFLSTDPVQDSDGLTDGGQQGRTQFTLPTFTVTSMSIDPTGPDEYQTSSAPVTAPVAQATPAEIQQKYRQFIELLPLTLALAGLPVSEGRLYSEDQIEGRAMTIRTAYRLARSTTRDILGGS